MLEKCYNEEKDLKSDTTIISKDNDNKTENN